MDPFEKLDLNGDTTFALALEAQKRKHEIFHFLPGYCSIAKAKHFTAFSSNGRSNTYAILTSS